MSEELYYLFLVLRTQEKNFFGKKNWKKLYPLHQKVFEIFHFEVCREAWGFLIISKYIRGFFKNCRSTLNVLEAWIFSKFVKYLKRTIRVTFLRILVVPFKINHFVVYRGVHQ